MIEMELNNSNSLAAYQKTINLQLIPINLIE